VTGTADCPPGSWQEQPSQARTLIAVENVSKRYPGVEALSAVSLAVDRGECRAICGENGAGKSTLMKILAGVETEFDGRVLLAGRPVRFAGPREARDAGISVIHQELSLVEELSVAANVFLGRELRTARGLVDDAAMERAASGFLAELGARIPPDQRVGELRMGEQQLVEIARALSLESEILIMDEPTSALTESEAGRLFAVIQDLRRRGVTILYVSHKLREVFELCDRISILRDGRLVATLDRAATGPGEITRLMVGREIGAATIPEARESGDVVLEVERLSLAAPGSARGWRLRGISLKVRRGEILGIAGLMGAGRTELLECLFGASPLPPLGRIALEGRQVWFETPHDAIDAGLGLVPEDRKLLGLFPQMTVRENITVAVLDRTSRRGFVSRSREARLAAEATQRCGIKAAGLDDPILTLSGGNQQKALIARWLETRPKVLLLDDPTRGVDVGAKAELYLLLDRLRREGLAIVLTSSELPELLKLCDRILVLHEGSAVAEFPRADATEEKIMAAATGFSGQGDLPSNLSTPG
jgi:ribose transport system ATP-binding protein